MSNQNDIYKTLIQLMMHSKRHLVSIMERMHMTPVQGMMLMLFDNGEGKSMNQLSYIMGCDASNITGLVDRLDSQDLIERTVDPNDRRVKMIRLSDKGKHCRSEILKGLREAEAFDLSILTDEELKMLVSITDKLSNEKR